MKCFRAALAAVLVLLLGVPQQADAGALMLHRRPENRTEENQVTFMSNDCQCTFKGTCSCEESVAFMDCVANACQSGQCGCKGPEQFQSACDHMASTCPGVGLTCANVGQTKAEASCAATSGTEKATLTLAAPENKAETTPAPAQSQYNGPDWGIINSEGGNMKDELWEKDPITWTALIFASLFVCLIASAPLVIHKCDDHPMEGMTMTLKIESACLFVWLFGGLYLFTNVLYFQSPHFGGKVRSLCLEEAVYLFAQIITTVGYGDITPAKPRGQLFVGIFVVISFLVAASMAAQLSEIITHNIKGKLGLNDDHTDEVVVDPKANPFVTAFKPVLRSGAVFAFFVTVGTAFFVHYPGEGKTVSQGIYMSMVTLSTVGFGAFTPVTKPGMVFGAFWMLFGVCSLGAFVASVTAFILALKTYELAHADDAKACAA